MSFDAASSTVAAAIEEVTKAVTRATDALKGAGVTERELQTQGLTISERVYQGRRAEFTAQYGLAVTRRPIGDAGALIAMVADAVGASLRVHRVRLGFDDSSPLEREARRAAVVDARNKAEELAEAAGVTLGPVLTIEHGAVAPSGGQRFALARPSGGGGAPMPPPIEPGITSVAASVTMVFAIADE